MTTAFDVARELGLSNRFIADMDPRGYCPGFRLWRVTGTDGNEYLVSGDEPGGAGTRVYFATNGAVSVASAELVGDNPDADAWKIATNY